MDFKENEAKDQVLLLFDQEDMSKWESSRRKIVTAPLTFLVVSTGLIMIGKKIKIGNILRNPLMNKKVAEKNQGRMSILLKHTVLFVTIAFLAGAYFKKQFNKYFIFKKYEKEVNFYMRWKLESEILKFIRENQSLQNVESKVL